MKYFLILPAALLSLTVAAQSETTQKNAMKAKETCCSGTCTHKAGAKVLSCKLTSPEIQRRKATVIASLKRQVLERKELPNGYVYRFKGSDAVVDELSNFIKTERLCCDFFDFEVKVTGSSESAWLSITGPEGAKDFIQTELEF